MEWKESRFTASRGSKDCQAFRQMQSASSQSYHPGSMVVTLLDNEQPRDVLLKALWNPFESRKSLFSPTPNDTDRFCKAENVEHLRGRRKLLVIRAKILCAAEESSFERSWWSIVDRRWSEYDLTLLSSIASVTRVTSFQIPSPTS